MRRIVSDFYDRILDSPTLSPYFGGIEMRRIIDHQTKFIAQVMGGPVSYSNDALERVHAGLNIDGKAFDEMLSLLAETLEDHDVGAEDVALVRDDLASRARYIVTRR